MNVDPKPYYNRLSWKIVISRLLYKISVALVNLAFYIVKLFIATVLFVIIIERLINDRTSFDLMVNLFCILLSFMFIKAIIKYMLKVDKTSVYRTEIASFGFFDENGKPFDGICYQLVRVHDYGYVWNKFAEIADIFDPITYHLYDNNGNRVSNAILDRKSWDRPNLIKNEKE